VDTAVDNYRYPVLMRTTSFAAAACAIALGFGAVNYEAEGKLWWAHVQYLASNQLQGRDTGSEGYRKAAAYVAGKFKEDGLDPVGTDGYYQPMKLEVCQIIDDKSTAALVNPDGTVEPLKMGDDVVVSLNPDTSRDLEAPAVFVGYGLDVSEKKYNDLAGVDLKGKIAVYLGGIPAGIPGPLAAHSQSLKVRWSALREAGAIGTIRLSNPHSMDLPWQRIALARFNPHMTFAEPGLRSANGLQLSMGMNPASSDKLLAGTGHTMESLVKLADAHAALPHFDLKQLVRVHIEMTQREVESPNVAAILHGTDPKLQREYVVMSAHLDHLGVGKPINGDSIYNGAMDNASGVASILEIARLLHEDKTALKRSILFVAVTGEEKGLLGSQYFAAHPTVPANAVVADINLDMFLPLYPLHYLMTIGLNESTLGDKIRAVASREGVEVQDDKMPERNLFIRSDQYSFVKEGVPSVMFAFGSLPGSREEKIQEEWIHSRYHAPSDDVNQPVDLAAAAKFNDVMLHLLVDVANDNARPEWKHDSFFARFANAR
jgi:Zn-dependent M28 family amino/carboxypeptidase